MKAAYYRKIFIAAFLLILSLTSCVQPVYVPNKIQLPMFNKGEQIFASGGEGINSGANGAIAYAPLKNFYIEFGGNIDPGIKPFVPNYRTEFGYGSVGMFSWLSSHIIGELEGGFGEGSTEAYDGAPSAFFHEHNLTNAAYDRFHVQASLGFHTVMEENVSDNRANDIIFEGAFSFRLCSVTSTKYTVERYDSTYTYISTSLKSYSNFFSEYGITLRIGIEHIMLEMQALLSEPASYFSNVIPSSGGELSIGLVSRF